jgi:exodeoxyribonuclease VII small subunit
MLPSTIPIESLTYEQALEELEKIVDLLETQQPPLNDAMAFFERGQKLLQHCSSLLEQAELRVRQLTTEQIQSFSENE